MNDFFSVLDEFDFEEFVAPDGESTESFSLDVAGDASGEVPVAEMENTDEELTEVKGTKEEVEKNESYVWTESQGNPFGGTTAGVWLGFNSTVTSSSWLTDGGPEGSNFTYKIVSLSSIIGLSFTGVIPSANPLQINNGVAVAGTAGLNVDLNNGNITGGNFALGNGKVTLWGNYAANGDVLYNNGTTALTIAGMDDSSCSFTADNDNIKTIVTSKDEGGTVTVNGDYNFILDGEQVKIKNVDTTAAGNVVFTYGANGELEMNISALTAAIDTVLTVTDAGGATSIVPPQAATTADGHIKIGSLTFDYASVNGTAYFTTNDATVTGFVLVDVGDALHVTKKSDIPIYDEDMEQLIAVDGVNYTVTKLTNGYVVNVTESANITIDGTEFDFTISKATKSDAAFAGINIYFDEDGEIRGVQGLDQFSENDKVKVTGAVATNDESGIPFISSTTAIPATGVITAADIDGYIAIDDGAFTYVGAEAGGNPGIYVNDDATVYAVDGVAQVFVGETGGTITNNNKEFEYSSPNAKGYFITDANDEIVGYVFASKGDEVTLPTEDAIPVYYLTDATPVTLPTVEDSDGKFTVTMTDDGIFEVSGLLAGATVADADDEVTFSTDGGVVSFGIDGEIIGIYNYVGSLELTEADNGLIVNGNVLTMDFVDDTQTVTATSTDGTKVDAIGNLQPGDVVASYIPVTLADAETAFIFNGTGGTDVYTVNGRTYTVQDDDTGVTITADGKLTGLDEDAKLVVTGFEAGETLYVNGKDYVGTDANGKDIVGFETKGKDLSSYIVDPNRPLFSSSTDQDDIKAYLGVDGAPNVYTQTADGSMDLSATTGDGRAQYTFNTSGEASVIFNNDGKNVAIVDDTATGDKTIVLGNKGDAVIMDGHDEYGSVNITTGAGNDTIVVRGNVFDPASDAVYKGSMTTTINMGSEGIDKVITYAAANADIVLNNYDVNSKSGVAFHDPELPYIKENIEDAIKSGLLVFENGSIVAIDRGEADGYGALPEGTDRKTTVTVNNVTSNPSTMIRLFGYKDSSDGYSDDFGQVVGFTGATGGTLDASGIGEEVVLVGNYDGTKLAGSSLVTGIYDDTVFAGAGDTIDTGDGVDTIILDDTLGREAAAIIVGRGAGDAVENLKSGFDGDIFDVTAFDGKLDYIFTDGVLGIVDESSKSTLLAQTDEDGQFIKQRFVNGPEILYAAIAEEGGTITVGGGDDIVPNYYLAKDGAIDFSAYSGEVRMDVDGEDNDWSGPNQIGDTANVTLGSAVNTLIGGTGTTIFKGGKGNETLVAGTGESSLYGGGGQNVLVGNTSGDKFESTEFFNIGIHNGAQNTIVGFEFIEQGATNQATFDNLNLGMADGNDVTDLRVVDGNVQIAVKGDESGATEKATIIGAAGQEMLVDRGTDTETVAQIAASEVTVNNSYVDFYAATEKNATVKIGTDITNAKVWLEAPDFSDGVEFVGDYTVIDASDSTANVEMAGNNVANTIIGGQGNASMWGGAGNANDVMIAGSVHNEFYYEMGNGNDTILGGLNGDIIHLGATLDQIDFDGTTIESGAINVSFKDGGSLNIQNSAEVTFSFDDGTAIKANRQTQQFE